MPSKYVMTSNARCDENMRYDIIASECLSSLIALLDDVFPMLTKYPHTG